MVLTIEQWRTHAKASVAVAAKQIGVTKRTWERWVEGEDIPCLEHLCALSDVTGVSPGDLLDEFISKFRIRARV